MILSAKYPAEIENLIIWGSNAYVIPEELESYESKLFASYTKMKL